MFLGECIRLCRSIRSIFERAHLVFFRAENYENRSLSPLILSVSRKRFYPYYDVSRTSNIFISRDQLLDYERTILQQFQVDSFMELGGHFSLDALETLYDILDPLYETWLRDIERLCSLRTPESHHCLDKFTAAYIRTRLIYKRAYILTRSHRYKEAHEVYDNLLKQRHYRRDKRGSWYQEKALIEMHYMNEDKSDDKAKKIWKETALKTCVLGLQDPDTNIIYHYDLQKRIMRLEKDLKITRKARHIFDHVKLREPNQKVFYGEPSCNLRNS